MSEIAPPRRFESVDAARGLAVLAMFVFHFTWDLGHFGHIDAEIPYSRGVKAFGHTIAFSFLFIAGVSLVLAQRNEARWPRFWRRLALVTGAALLVSAATWIVFPDAFVFFGILHCIAASSLVAAPFLFLPWPAALAGAAALWFAPEIARNSFFDSPQWWWTGLSTFEPATNDYRPLLPWAGAMLAGIGTMKALRSWLVIPGAREASDRESRVASRPVAFLNSRSGLRPAGNDIPNGSVKALTFLGRHSLLLYLAHQPLFFAAFMVVALLTQHTVAKQEQSFEQACEAQCVASGGDARACRSACACTAQEASSQNALSGVIGERERQARIGEIARRCSMTSR